MRIGRLDVAIDGRHIALSGRIDDSINLAQLATEVSGPEVVLDTAGVVFVNSVGTREWIRFQRALRERGIAIVLDRVADVLITQINMIPELATGVTVTSFHAQYACGACGYEGAPLVDAVAHRAALARLAAPPIPCPECGAAMELADFPERYLSIFRE